MKPIFAYGAPHVAPGGTGTVCRTSYLLKRDRQSSCRNTSTPVPVNTASVCFTGAFAGSVNAINSLAPSGEAPRGSGTPEPQPASP